MSDWRAMSDAEMSDNEKIDILIRELRDLRAVMEFGLQNLDRQLQMLEQRVKRLERARRMTAAEALESFEALKRLNPSLTLQAFADDYGMKYETLKKARTRRNRQR